MTMTKKMGKKKKKKALINQQTILQMSHEEKVKLQKESDDFFDSLPDDFFTDPREEKGLENLKKINKDECHRAVMALLFL